MTIRVAIVEDHPGFSARFSAAVQAEPGFELVGTASNGADGAALIDNTQVDVFLIDLGLPDMDGSALIRRALQTHPACNVLVITIFDDDQHIIASIEAGATGYLLKDSTQLEIVDCIRQIRDGGSPLSPAIAARVLRLFRTTRTVPAAPADRPMAADPHLTEREIQILRLLSTGMGFREIGEALGISVHTVAQHNRNIYSKLVVRSRGEAVFEATRMGIISL